jgi:succinate dehydrogenase / fumarate reductase, cytochrome b subunit
MQTTKIRPKYLNLFEIRLPLPGWVSILHRVSGAALFLFGIPLLLATLGASLRDEAGYSAVRDVFAHPLVKLIALGFAWAFLHHFCAGIRYLLHDLHIGVSLPAARLSAKIVLAVSILLTLLVAVRLW